MQHDNNTPVTRIVAIFGGQTALARAIGTRQSVIYGWVDRGCVPSRRVHQVIEAAEKLSPPVSLTPADFFDLTGKAA